MKSFEGNPGSRCVANVDPKAARHAARPERPAASDAPGCHRARCAGGNSWAKRSPGPCPAMFLKACNVLCALYFRSVCRACLPGVPGQAHVPMASQGSVCADLLGKRCLGETPVTPDTSLYLVVARPVLPSVVFESITHPIDSERPAFCCLCLNPVIDLHCKCVYPAKVFPCDNQRSGLSLSQLTLLPYLLTVSLTTSNVAVFPDG